MYRLASYGHQVANTVQSGSSLGGAESPMTDHLAHDSFILTSAPLEMISEEQVKTQTQFTTCFSTHVFMISSSSFPQTTIKCWKTMYNLLELYSTMPTTKTVIQRQSLTPISNAAAGAAAVSAGASGRKNLIQISLDASSSGLFVPQQVSKHSEESTHLAVVESR